MDEILNAFSDLASNLSFRDLPASVVTTTKERLLDALGCALGAFDCDTAEIGRSIAGPPASKALAGRILGSRRTAAADAAAFINTCMIRDLDFNDTYPGGHPSDSLGGLFAVAPQIGASGERLITATVVAYEIFIRLQMKAQLRERGWDQGFGVSVGAAAGLANLMGLDRDVAKHAMAITAVANMPMRATRAGQLSMWKGAATAYAVRNAVFEKEFPRVVSMRVTAKDRSGKTYEVKIVNPLGHEDNPVSAKELAEKFMRLAEPRLGERRASAALKRWQDIETEANSAEAFDALVVRGIPGRR